jgi:hypothetical protein
MRYKIVNIMEGFQNSYNQMAWQVWVITEDNRRMLCNIFRTRKQAREFITGEMN